MVAAEAVEARESEPARTGGKSVDAFRTTGEVAAALDLPAHVLRFWESKFPQIRPLKRGGGRRYYRPRDIELLRRIRECLYQQGYTIRGVQKLLRDGGLKVEKPATPSDREEGGPPAVASDPATGPPQSIGIADGSSAALRETLETVRRELLEIRALLDGLGAF